MNIALFEKWQQQGALGGIFNDRTTIMEFIIVASQVQAIGYLHTWEFVN